MKLDFWHYPRTELASQVLSVFDSGLSSALVFFAPRRMGKTEFLRKDIEPLAIKKKWQTFYFSFLDTEKDAAMAFTLALARFAESIGSTAKAIKFLKHIKNISGEAAGIKGSITFNDPQELQIGMKEILGHLASKYKILLLLDEIQVLAKNKENEIFIASLRTVLDMNKDNLKVIFTGSSREGLRRMFSQSSAPFFHFGQNLPFPELDRPFIEHLSAAFRKVTQREIDENKLWDAFILLGKIPQLTRSLVERLVLQPELTITEIQQQLLVDIFNDRAFIEIWEHCSHIEKLLLEEIARGKKEFFTEKVYQLLAKKLNKENITSSTVQSAIRALQRKQLIGRTMERSDYFIDDPNFKNWILRSN